MREILFRGKRLDNGEWVEGGYRAEKVGGYITAVSIVEHLGHGAWNNYRVDPSTVGQYTGLCDKNGKKIFEGDIVKFLRYVGKIVFEEGSFGLAIGFNDAFDWDYIDEEMKQFTGVGQSTACFNNHFISLWEILWNCNCDHNDCDVVEVIGNIHDNPELLEVSHE